MRNLGRETQRERPIGENISSCLRRCQTQRLPMNGIGAAVGHERRAVEFSLSGGTAPKFRHA